MDNHEVIVVDEAEEIKKAKKEHRKLNHKERGALFVVPIREYADDAELYESKYDAKSRTAYWNHLNSNPRKHIKKVQESWIDVSQRNNFDIEVVKYRKHARRVLAFAATSYWDYLYIYFLGLMLVLAVMFYDDWLQDYIRIPFNLLAVPPFFMFLTQLVPTISAVFVSSRYNDLVKLVARQTFGHWVRRRSCYEWWLKSYCVSSYSLTVYFCVDYIACVFFICDDFLFCLCDECPNAYIFLLSNLALYACVVDALLLL